MTTGRHAIIDVGTNSVKLLVADVSQDNVTPLLETSQQTRLGKGLFLGGQLEPEAIRQTARAVQGFARRARECGAVSIRVVATNAAREAKNSRQLVDAIAAEAALPLEVIPGEVEADLAYRGVLTAGRDYPSGLLLLDVGGGSTELIIGTGSQPAFSGSFPLGTVRMLELFPHSDPPTATEHERLHGRLKSVLADQVAPAIHQALPDTRLNQLSLIGTGGTATLLARMAAGLHKYDRNIIEATRLTADDVTRWEERLWSLPLTGRRTIVGLPAEKADVILVGVAIYRAIMECWQLPVLQVSMRGLRFGALLARP